MNYIMDPNNTITLYPNDGKYYPIVKEDYGFYPLDKVPQLYPVQQIRIAPLAPIPESPNQTISFAFPYRNPDTGVPQYIPGRPINLNPESSQLRRRQLGMPSNYYGNQTIAMLQQLTELRKQREAAAQRQTYISPLSPYGVPNNVNGYTTIYGIADGNLQSVQTSAPQPNVKYTGAGIILFHYYTNLSGRNALAVVLFRNVRTQMYEDLGGIVDNKDNSLVSTAIREAYEESAQLFKFKNIVKYVDIINNGEGYRAYTALITSENSYTWQYIYQQNRNTLIAHNAPEHLRESDDMQYFYIDDIRPALTKDDSDFMCIDANGTIRKIRGRTKLVLKSILNSVPFLNGIIQNQKSGTLVKNSDNTSSIVFE